MQQTAKYKLNLIESGDAFGADALNQNAQTTERELSALESSASSALTAHAGSIAQHCFVKLGAVEVPANTLSDPVPVTDPESYALFLAVIRVHGPSTTPYRLTTNGGTGGRNLDTNCNSNGAGYLHFLVRMSGDVAGGHRLVVNSNALASPYTYYNGGHTWSTIKSLDLIACDVPCSVIFYGLKA